MLGWKRQQGKGWGDRESMREDRSFQRSVRMTVFNCVCACMCALSDVHSWMFICASMQTKSLADMDFLRTICFSVCTVICMGVKVKLAQLKQRCDMLGEVRLAC